MASELRLLPRFSIHCGMPARNLGHDVDQPEAGTRGIHRSRFLGLEKPVCPHQSPLKDGVLGTEKPRVIDGVWLVPGS